MAVAVSAWQPRQPSPSFLDRARIYAGRTRRPFQTLISGNGRRGQLSSSSLLYFTLLLDPTLPVKFGLFCLPMFAVCLSVALLAIKSQQVFVSTGWLVGGEHGGRWLVS